MRILRTTLLTAALVVLTSAQVGISKYIIEFVRFLSHLIRKKSSLSTIMDCRAIAAVRCLVEPRPASGGNGRDGRMHEGMGVAMQGENQLK